MIAILEGEGAKTSDVRVLVAALGHGPQPRPYVQGTSEFCLLELISWYPRNRLIIALLYIAVATASLWLCWAFFELRYTIANLKQ